MPTLLAMCVASLAAWLVDSACRPIVGTGASLVLSFVSGTFGFYFARKFFADMRG